MPARTGPCHRLGPAAGCLLATAVLLLFRVLGSLGKDVDTEEAIAWSKPDEMERAAHPGPDPVPESTSARSTNYLRVQLLRVQSDREAQVGVFAPASTNAYGFRARILSSQQMEKLRQSIYEDVLTPDRFTNTESHTPTIPPEQILREQLHRALLGVQSGGTLLVPTLGKEFYFSQIPAAEYYSRFAGPSCSPYPTNFIVVDLHPTKTGDSFAVRLRVTSIDRLGPPRTIEGIGEIPTDRTNAAFICRAAAPDGNGLLLEIGRGTTAERLYGLWLFIPFEMIDPKTERAGP